MQMANINLTRVVLGGLLSGLLLNIGEFILNEIVLEDQWATFRAASGMDAFSTAQVLSLVVITFLFGIALIWIYAAIRPRFGPGPKTAVIAGLTMWVIAWLLIGLSYFAAGLSPAGLTFATIAWGIFEAPLAAIAGAWLYRESEGT